MPGIGSLLGGATSILGGSDPLAQIEQLLQGLEGGQNSSGSSNSGSDSSGFSSLGSVLKDVAPIAEAVCAFL